jgi:UDP-N-acetylglucosamine:LPS N-acetylglucosamine transferase
VTRLAHRALLLSGSLGMGHDVMAEACATSLDHHGWESSTLDAMAMMGGFASRAGEKVFRRLISVPGVYDAMHFSALRPGARLALYLDRQARGRILVRLRQELEQRPVGLILSVFATGASAGAQIRRESDELRHLVFCSDVTPHRMWVHEGVDGYLVTSRVAEASVRRFQPHASVTVVPTPVRAPFYDPPTQADARRRWEVPADVPCVLLMSGGWGLGPLAAAARALADAGVHVLAVAGRNPALQQRLEATAAEQPLVHAFGFTDQVPSLMAACDLVVTSSGDTCTEARVIGRPLLLLDVVPGHGRENLQHELELGDAGVTSADAESVERNTLAALESTKPATERVLGTPDAWEAAFASALVQVGLLGGD